MTGTDRPRVGFIGLGIMGSLMAANLAREGFPLSVTTRTPGKAEAWVAEHGDMGMLRILPWEWEDVSSQLAVDRAAELVHGDCLLRSPPQGSSTTFPRWTLHEAPED